ncbi:MAG: hypothetical protein HGA65_16480 [Oscillochloris sp.]|nr:hypothetical protein [Oscillochloris sp.]
MKSTSRLREIRTEIDMMSREVQSRPTGVLSGGDIDIAYHYLGMSVGVIALLYSLLGTIFALHGGGSTFVAAFLERWTRGPAAALIDTLLTPQTIVAMIIQAVIFIVMVGTRRDRRSWQHWAALISSVALTYAGWSTLLLTYAMPLLLSLSAVIPAVLLGGALGWGVARISSEGPIARSVLVSVVLAGVLAGALGSASLTHWVGLLLAWSVDHVARKMIVIG